MGYNRAGKRRTDRQKRAKRHEERLLLKASAPKEAGQEGHGLLAKVKGVAKAAVSAVESVVHSAVDVARRHS